MNMSKKNSIDQNPLQISKATEQQMQSKGYLSSLSKNLKKYKSQEVYSITPKNFQIKSNFIDKNINTSLNKSNSKQNSKENIPSLKQLSTPYIQSVDVNNYNFNQLQSVKTDLHLDKIMSDGSVQELDSIDNIDEEDEESDDQLNDSSQIDKKIENYRKSSEVNSDFYISQINENVQQIDKDFTKRTSNFLINPFMSQELFKPKSQMTIEGVHRKFLISAKKGDKDAVLECIESIVADSEFGDINYADEGKWTALHYACNEGCLKIVQILIKANCDVNALTNDKQTGLHLAASHGYFDISKVLIENGCSLNQVDVEKNSPVHLCAQGGYLELLQFFLEKFPQLDLKNIYGKTPYDLAIKSDIKEIIKQNLNKKESRYNHITIQTANELHIKQMFQNLQEQQEKINNININIQANINNSCNNNSNQNLYNRNISQKIQINDKVNVKIKANIVNTQKNSQSSNKQKNSVSETLKKRAIKAGNSLTRGYKMKSPSNSKKNSKNNINTTNNSNTNNNMGNKPSNYFPKTRTLPSFSVGKKLRNNNNNNNNNIQPSPAKPSKRTALNFESERKDKPQKMDLSLSNHKTNKALNKTDEIENGNNKLYSQIDLCSIEEEKIAPTSFICLALLGKGSFGEVYLVKHISTEYLYAMKVLSKNRIKSQNLYKYVMAERNVLSLTNHPFIVKLNFAFQTSHKLFLILDYCSNGDLSKHLYYEKRFTESRAKFYLCEIALALEDLHRRDIIFRDLKPDNIVLDEEGHAKLTDFGLSKEGVFDSSGAKSFCGSIAYLAPEMLKRVGHGKAVDWYLLGVLFYEMLVGIPPFFTNQKEDIFRNIEFAELQIPKFVSKPAEGLLRALMQKDPLKRLGGGSEDAAEIKGHPYFADVNWEDVYNKKITPPKVNCYPKAMQVYNKPRYFLKDDDMFKNGTDENYLNGWSFVINDAN